MVWGIGFWCVEHYKCSESGCNRLSQDLRPRTQHWLLLCQLLYFVAVLDLIDEDFGRLKAGNEMLIDNDSRIAGNVSGNFFLSLFIDETSESANINIMAARHGIFYNRKEGFYRGCNIGFIDAGLLCDLIDNVCFRHGAGVL